MLRFDAANKELFGYSPRAANNRMKLMAPIQGLLALKEPGENNRPVRNADLWIELDELVAIHKTNWLWTKGHAAHDDNNRCDWLAQNAARTQTSSLPDGSPHGRLRHDFGPDWVPPNPQGGLFDNLQPEDDEEDESDPG